MAKTRHSIQGCGTRTLLATLQILLLVALLPSVSLAAGVVLAWDPSTDTDVAGYKVYYQANSPSAPFSGTGAAQGGAPVDVGNVTTATLSGLDSGSSYYFAVTAYNAAGVESPYSNIVEKQESLPPTVSVTAPGNKSSVSGIVSITANASDNVGVTSVRFFVNGQEIGESTSAPYSTSWNTGSLAAGSYTITAKAYDAAGNEGSSAAVAVTVVGDTVKPVVTLGAPVAGATLTGTAAVSASATDNVGVTRLDLSVDGTLTLSGNQSQLSYFLDSTALANGSHAICAKGYDASGNTGEACVTVAVNNPVRDTVPPSVTAFSMPASSSALDVAVPLFSATDVVGVTGYLITESASAPPAAVSGWSATAPSSFRFAAPGTRTAYAWAKDAAGNVSASMSATVAITLPDTTAPTASVALPGTVVGGTVAVTASASDDVAVTKLDLYLGSKLIATSNNPSLTLNWNSAAVANGSYTFTAKAYDAAGNVGTAAPVTVTVFNDTAAPVLTVNPVTSPVSTTSQIVSGSVSDDGTVAAVTVQLGSGTPMPAVVTGTKWTFQVTGLAVGANPLTVRAVDASGKSTVATTEIVVEQTASATTQAPLTIADAQMALQIAVGLLQPTAAQLARLDVAGGADGKIDVSDAVTILHLVVGLSS